MPDYEPREKLAKICSSVFIWFGLRYLHRQKKDYSRIGFVRNLSGALHMFNDLLNDFNCYISRWNPSQASQQARVRLELNADRKRRNNYHWR